MWFILGMMVGAGISEGSGGHRLTALGDIPIRCFVALDQGDAAYKDCRRIGLAYQLYQQVANTPVEYSGYQRGTLQAKVEQALDMELTALRAIERAQRSQPAR